MNFIKRMVNRGFRHKKRENLVQTEAIAKSAQVSGDPLICSPELRRYYAEAELAIDSQWETIIWPVIKELDFGIVIDLAAGYGRNSAKLLDCAQQLTIVDISKECIDYCKERFEERSNVTFIRNDGFSLKEIRDESVTLIYTFDSMVHFDSDVVKEYLKEFYRVLKPGGNCFCHHSNYVGQPRGNIEQSPHRRNFMSKELFAHYSIKAGLKVVKQNVIDWSDDPNLDCITVLAKD